MIASPNREYRGEISQYSAQGKLLSRWTGFSDIGNIEMTAPGRLMVFERGKARFVEFDRSGAVLHSGSLPQGNIFQGIVLPAGNLLLAAGREGLIELDGSGREVWRASPPGAGSEIVGAARVGDGTILCVARYAAFPLYRVPPGSNRFFPVAVPVIGPFNDSWEWPRLRVLDSAARHFALWYGPWTHWYQFRWGSSGLEDFSMFRAKGKVSAVAPGLGRVVWVAESEFEVVQSSSPGKEGRWFATADGIRDLAREKSGGVFVATERTQDHETRAHRPPAPGHRPFSWFGLALWVLCGLLFIGFLQVLTWRRSLREFAPSPSPESSPALPGADRLQNKQWIPFATAAFLGLGVAGVGSLRLHQQGTREAIPILLEGSLLAAVAGQLWSRAICRRVDRWWLKTRTARLQRGLIFPTWCTATVLVAGGLVLWRWRASGTHPNGAISLWVFLQILCVGLMSLSPRRHRLGLKNFPWETVFHVTGLLLLASLALSADLDSVPQNVHNDVGSVVDSALRLLEGRVDDFFSGGYADVPYPGHLPTSLGLLIAGKTVAGSRCGVMLMGVVAVLGTYALGREYKSARSGLFASLFLLGSIPFLHFSRSTHFGEVVAYSVWALYLLLRAVRTAHPGAWLACGAVAGWGLFLFYSARVALVGVVIAGVLLSLRSLKVTLRRWYGPLLFLLGFGVVVVPMVPYWLSHPGAFFSRMDTSFSLYDPHSGFHREVLARALGEPFLKTIGMFYGTQDGSGQGTLSPAAGPIEATLLSIGLAAALADGWGANAACLSWFVVMLLGCGTFAEATPWYTRLVPITPVASLFMARAIDLLMDMLPLTREVLRQFITAVVAASLIGGVTLKNLKTYLNYEHERPLTEFTAFGRAAHALGSRYQFYCVTFQRPEFTCLNGSFVPYFATLDVRDLRDPVRAMPFPAGRPVAIMIPFWRFVPRPLDPRLLVKEIVLRYPGADVRYIFSERNGPAPPIGAIVLVTP